MIKRTYFVSYIARNAQGYKIATRHILTHRRSWFDQSATALDEIAASLERQYLGEVAIITFHRI